MPAGALSGETMGVNNGSVLLEEEQQETSTDKMVQITLVSQSQSTLQESKLRDVTHRLEKLNQSYRLLFSQYPALNQYCPVSNTTTGERKCRQCPAGWTLQGEKCFLFSQDRADWISSQYRCMALGGAVATVGTEEEQLFLWKTAQSLSQGDSYWLGLRISGDGGGWQWSNGSPVEKGLGFWEREPDKTDSRALCGRLTPRDNYRKSWYTYRCSNLLRRICERRRATLQ
ncbi:lactose-binding lectin l-2-like isoform X4 [Sander vitreus]